MSSKTNAQAKSQSKSSPNRSHKPRQNKNDQQRTMLMVGLAALALVAVAVFFLIESRPPAAAGLPGEVNVQQANEMFQAGAFLLDVRTQEEWNDAHVDGATLIPLNQLAARMNEVPKDREVVIICRSGNRSAQARDLLAGNGFTGVTSVAGGMNDWRAAGFPTVSGP